MDELSAIRDSIRTSASVPTPAESRDILARLISHTERFIEIRRQLIASDEELIAGLEAANTREQMDWWVARYLRLRMHKMPELGFEPDECGVALVAPNPSPDDETAGGVFDASKVIATSRHMISELKKMNEKELVRLDDMRSRMIEIERMVDRSK